MESPMFFTVLDSDDHRRAVRDVSSPLARSAGRVLPGVELRITGEDGSASAAGQPGEILARAPQTMNGYWNRPEATAQALADGWLHTGDVGYLDEAGYLYIVDRKKDMIVTGGSNVYAGEVEAVLLELPQVKDAAVIGTPHRIWGEAVTAVLVPGRTATRRKSSPPAAPASPGTASRSAWSGWTPCRAMPMARCSSSSSGSSSRTVREGLVTGAA
jgi:acyl-CoA synthetase (AMP-forming)/AMP-acid ligase II